MAISNYKIAVGDYANKDVASLPNVPGESGYTPEQVKARFDSLVKNVVAPKYNNLIDALTCCLPYIGFPRTLNALGCVNAVIPEN